MTRQCLAVFLLLVTAARAERINREGRILGPAPIASAGLAPANDLESAIVIDLAPGNYTAVVSGVNGATGVALVEAYHLQ